MLSSIKTNSDPSSQNKPVYTEKQVIDMLRTIFVDHDGRVDMKQFPRVRHALDNKFMLSDSFSSQTDQAVFDSIDVKNSGFVSFRNSLIWQLQRLRQKKRLMDEPDALSDLVNNGSRQNSKEASSITSKTASASSTMPAGFNIGRRRSEPLIGDNFSQERTASKSTAVRAGNGIIAGKRDQNRPKKLHIQIHDQVSPRPDSRSPRPHSRSPSPPQTDRAGSPQCPGPNYKYERGQWRLKTAKQIMSDLDSMEQIAKKARDEAKDQKKKLNSFKNNKMFKTNDTVATSLTDTDDEN